MAAPDQAGSGRKKGVGQAVLILAALVLVMAALAYFGRDGTRVTPGGVSVPTERGAPTSPTLQAPVPRS